VGLEKRQTHTRVYAMSGTTRWMAAGPLRDYLEKVSEENKEKAKYCHHCSKKNASHWEGVSMTPKLIRSCKECCLCPPLSD